MDRAELKRVMDSLDLNVASSAMAAEVGFVLAIPILQPANALEFREPAPVAGVIFVDCTADNFFIGDEELGGLVMIAQQFIDGLVKQKPAENDLICNVPYTELGREARAPEGLPPVAEDVLDLVAGVNPPASNVAFQFNFDYSDFIPVEG